MGDLSPHLGDFFGEGGLGGWVVWTSGWVLQLLDPLPTAPLFHNERSANWSLGGGKLVLTATMSEVEPVSVQVQNEKIEKLTHELQSLQNTIKEQSQKLTRIQFPTKVGTVMLVRHGFSEVTLPK